MMVKKLNKIRTILRDEYGVDGSINDRALTARIAGVAILAGKGVYKAKQDKYINPKLAEKIYQFIDTAEIPIMLTASVYDKFKTELESEGVDNHYYLHGILGELYSDKLYFKRDYVYRDSEITSVYEGIILYLQNQDYPVTKRELIEHFYSVTEAVINMVVRDENILNYFGAYLHSF